MIHIDKGSDIPTILSTGRGKTEKDKLCADFDSDPASFQAQGAKPSKKHVFNTKIYSSKSVKKRLIKLQHNKCCFSEAKFNGDYGDVEHFRPKSRLGEENSKIKTYPGYYWLAYSWDNLFLCKQVINISHKKDLFPLLNGVERARSHHENHSLEDPVLIDPSLEDPRQHINFHQDEPVGITDRGRKTITLLNLRHPHFEETRRKRFKCLKLLKGVLEDLDSDCEKAKEIRILLNYAVSPEAEYSSMAIDLLQYE